MNNQQEQEGEVLKNILILCNHCRHAWSPVLVDEDHVSDATSRCSKCHSADWSGYLHVIDSKHDLNWRTFETLIESEEIMELGMKMS